EEQVAFEKLRNSLVTPPVFAYPNFNEKFLLFTDTCKYGIGAVLSQLQDGQEHPIAYSSRQLTKAEMKYSTTEKEALAVVDAIKYFRHYLLDKSFEIISDHRPLQWLKNQKDNNGRLGRWAILLAATNYELKYRPGRVHQNADCLSRLKVASIQPLPNSSYICQRMDVNRLIPRYETMLWKTEPCPPIENPSDFENRFRKSIATQTQDPDIAMENQDHEEILASDDYEDDTTQTTDHFEDVNVSQQQADVVSVHRPSSEDNISNTEESDNETQSVQHEAITENDSARAEVEATESLPFETEEETPTENPELLHVTRRPQRDRQKPLRYRDGV
ncbi:Uncharacterized protein APZ42_006652, partial [Daphnia magna]